MIKTKNIYFAAYLFTQKLEYTGNEIIHDTNNKNGVVFSFQGTCEEDESILQAGYEESSAMANIREYIDNLVLVRELMYKAMDDKKRPKVTVKLRRMPK